MSVWYSDKLTAEQLLSHIANSYIELSHDKVHAQRNHFVDMCKHWLAHNKPNEQVEGLKPLNDKF